MEISCEERIYVKKGKREKEKFRGGKKGGEEKRERGTYKEGKGKIKRGGGKENINPDGTNCTNVQTQREEEDSSYLLYRSQHWRPNQLGRMERIHILNK